MSKMSLEYETEKLCCRWKVEYDCWRMWNEFSKYGTVDTVATGALYDWGASPHPENFGDRQTHNYRLLMYFMCKIAEAAKNVSESSPRGSMLGTLLFMIINSSLSDILPQISKPKSDLCG